MNQLKTIILGSAILALGAGAMAAGAAESTSPKPHRFAHGGRMHEGFSGGAPLISLALKHKSQLNLTSEQVGNLEKIKTHYQNQVSGLHQQVRAIENEIASLSQQSPVNLIQVKAKIQEAEKFRSELRYLRVEALENGRSVLNAQQRDQLKTLVSARHDNFRKMHRQPS